MATWVDRLGTYNPQFLRECRGRLKPRSVIAAVGLSLIFQFLLYIGQTDIAGPMDAEAQREICQTLSWILPYALFVVGGYYIVDDLGKEEKTGTLNFIRLSPRPAVEILLGKLLGVPMLPMMMVASAVPLHVVSGLLGGASLAWLVSYYLLLIFATVFVFSLALLFGLVGSVAPFGRQQAVSAIGFAGLALFAIAPMFMFWNLLCTWWTFGQGSPLLNSFDSSQMALEWVYLPIAANVVIAHLFTLGQLTIASLLTWRILLRKFRIPQATLLSKRLSYIGVAYLNVLVWGFFQSKDIPSNVQQSGILALLFLNFVIFLALIFALAPSRQTLLDWLRYRPHRQLSLTDWLWHDGSPSMGAIAINLAIALGLILPWLLIIGKDLNLQAGLLILSMLSIATNVLSYATLVQIVFSMRLRSPFVWAIGIMATLAFVPPTILAILSDTAGSRPPVMISLWTFLGLPFWEEAENSVAFNGILFGWLLQLAVLALLFAKLRQNLRQLAPHTATGTN